MALNPKNKKGHSYKFEGEARYRATEQICKALIAGQSIRDAIKADPENLPHERKFYEWIATDPRVESAVRSARVHQMMVWAEEIVSLADDAVGTYTVSIPVEKLGDRVSEIDGQRFIRWDDEEIKVKLDRQTVSEARLRIDTRKWLMTKLAPDDFGEKIQHDHRHMYEEMDDAELMAELNAAIKESGVSPEDIVGMLTQSKQ